MVNFGDDDINRETVGFGARDPTTDNDQPNCGRYLAGILRTEIDSEISRQSLFGSMVFDEWGSQITSNIIIIARAHSSMAHSSLVRSIEYTASSLPPPRDQR